eukprot:gnl/TRDRNA2_/TRDRNA2_155612_c0_seq1.p1 gnl/TRDRNA2_/TRDRNA2_155612_c0~~gnl/TRDRNA2_/TRDRNA2_155612_c0_seq1.p1  ORF type:complete len:712 (-),score=125.06 gnl/TRDRNA2_/TRDRNA2_155612_c0_seq1:76-2154(-)
MSGQRSALAKGFFNKPDKAERKSRNAAGYPVNNPAAAPAEGPPELSAGELSSRGDQAAERGESDLAAECYGLALARAAVAGKADSEAIAQHAEKLLRANCADDARRLAAIGVDAGGGLGGDVARWVALKRGCKTVADEVADVVKRVAQNPEAPPIPALLQLLRSGLYDKREWDALAKVATPFFENMADALRDSGALVKNGLLAESRFATRGSDVVEVLLFPDETWQGGRHLVLPLDKLPKGPLRTWGGATFIDCSESSNGSRAVPWPCVRCDDWIRSEDGPALRSLATPPSGVEWPPPRAPIWMIRGAAERAGLDDSALSAVRTQRAVVIAGAHLLPAAEAKWSLEHFEETVPSDTADASKFSVYRATSMHRTFRYADADAKAPVYDIEQERQAERVYMSFSEFAQKKRACAAGEGDGWAYYLWGVALRRSAGGDYEGYNFGQSVDGDLSKGHHWEGLEKIRAAGGWGELRQAQIFIGCRNALTPCHYDLVHNAYMQVRGWKRFLLFDPAYGGCLYPYPVAHPMDRCARVDLEAPDFSRFPRLAGARCVEAVLGPGDALVIPAGWWHHVQSLTEDSVSISFWYTDIRSGHSAETTLGSTILPSLDRVLLAREVEMLLEQLMGGARVRSAIGQLRGMLGGQAPKPEPEEVLPCCFILWRIACVLGPAAVRYFVRGLADDERFTMLKLRKEGKK